MVYILSYLPGLQEQKELATIMKIFQKNGVSVAVISYPSSSKRPLEISECKQNVPLYAINPKLQHDRMRYFLRQVRFCFRIILVAMPVTLNSDKNCSS
jgi:hypothetical protein